MFGSECLRCVGDFNLCCTVIIRIDEPDRQAIAFQSTHQLRHCGLGDPTSISELRSRVGPSSSSVANARRAERRGPPTLAGYRVSATAPD
jgi:hypothetical protein